MINYYLLLNVNGIQNRGLKMVTSKFTEILLFIYTVIEKKHKERREIWRERKKEGRKEAVEQS